MALNFQPPQPDTRYEDNERFAQQIGQGIQNIGNTIAQNRMARQAAERQALLDRYLSQEQERKAQEATSKYGTPINLGTMVAEPSPVIGQTRSFGPVKTAQGRNLKELFDQFRAGGMKPEEARPEFIDALGQEERQKFQEQASPQGQADLAYKQAQAKKMEAEAGNLRKTGSIFGKAPTGYRYDANGNLEPIPGGPADAKVKDAKAKADQALSGQKDKANLVIQKVDQVLSNLSGFNTGGMSFTKNIPFVGQATGAVDVDADLTTIKALLGFEQLAEMKNQSKAGASGLGALSEREMQLLISARANLEQAQSQPQIRERLNEIKTHFQNWLKMEEGINPYANDSDQQGSASPQPTGQERIRVRDKKTGKTGSVSSQYFDPNKYERL